MEFSVKQPNTVETFLFHAKLAGPANMDTSGFVYRWDWENDKVWDTRFSAIPAVHKLFREPGEFTVAVEARAENGDLFTATRQVQVVQGFSAPKPDFRISPDSGNFKTVFTFDAGSTMDAEEENNLLTYSWDFDNDQRFDLTVKGNPVATHQFGGEGLFKVNLMVTDTSRLWARISKEVTVNRTDTLIVPVIRITPEFPSDLDTVHVFAGDSYYTGVPGVPFRYSWRRQSGAWSEPTDNPEMIWTRPPKGINTVRLRVYDPENLYVETVFDLVVSRANRQPVARITRNMRFGNILSVFEFSAWTSSDPDNIPSELQARWDFEGDGIWDTSFGYEKKITRVFTEPGVYTVTLQVMDPGELTAVAHIDIRVSPFANPTSTLKDIRDEQVYGTVKIGNQWWMGENLRWDMKQDGFGDHYPTWCFNNNPAICDVTGRLYYAETVARNYTGETEQRNVCPRGWHLPDIDEWLELIREVGPETAGTALNYGGLSDFNILLGGYGVYKHYGEFTEFEPDSLYKVAYFMTMPDTFRINTLQYKRNDTRVQFREMTLEGYYSVRCVKDR
jgi:uncharacterized protein (TIGR02145 family)